MEPRHLGAVSSVQLDEASECLYTGGRDAAVRKWSLSSGAGPAFISAYEDHTDWINDIALCDNGALLASGSSDGTVKLWSTAENRCMCTVRQHTDYVKALAYAPHKKYLFSAGLDQKLVITDLGKVGSSVDANPDSILFHTHPESIYSLGCNAAGTMVATGSTDKTLRIWDTRQSKPCAVLKGHTDVIKALALDASGTRCVSGSSDKTLRLWDLGQRRCIQTFAMHDDSIWAVKPTADFTRVYTGGRDNNVYVTDVNNNAGDGSVLLVVSEDPILNLELSRDERTVWVATASSTVSSYSTKRAEVEAEFELIKAGEADSVPGGGSGGGNSVNGSGSDPSSSNGSGGNDAGADGAALALSATPTTVIRGGPTVVKCHVLSDNHRVLTLDSEGDVTLWDIVTMKKLKGYGNVEFEAQAKVDGIVKYVPKWCAVDTKLGSLSVHLEGSSVYAAWMYGPAIDGLQCKREEKVNLGAVVVQALLQPWQDSINAEVDARREQTTGTTEVGVSSMGVGGGGGHGTLGDGRAALLETLHAHSVQQDLSHNRFKVPTHTPVMLTSCSEPSASLGRFTVESAAMDPRKSQLMKEEQPDWVSDLLFKAGNRCKPDPTKLMFHVEPFECKDKALELGWLEDTHLTCPSYFPIYKVQAHVISKLGLRPKDGSATVAIEITCFNGEEHQVLDPAMDLVTAKRFVYAAQDTSDDLTLQYKRV